MPTNLPPEYFDIEERYRAAKTPEEKISCIEEMLSVIPKHKGTDKLRGDLRRRLSKLRDAAQTSKSISRYESAFHIDREGAGQVAVIGPSNGGKSALVKALTNATPEVSDTPFTTWTPTPGMMKIENIQVQLIDTPSLDRGYIEPEFLDLIRRSDLILVVVDLQAFPIQQLEDTMALLEERGIVAQPMPQHEGGGRRMVGKPMLILVNKTDTPALVEDFEVLCELLEEEWPMLPTSVVTGRSLDRLEEWIFEQLGIIRIYSKPPGKEPDFTAPFVLEKGSTVAKFAHKVHQDFREHLKAARVWGHGVYDGQMVGQDHVLHDGDVVELRM